MPSLRIRLIAGLAAAALVAAACSSTSPSPTAEPSSMAEPSFNPVSVEPSASASIHEDEPAILFTAASATITVDGDDSDWSAIEGATVNVEQIRLDELPPEVAAEIAFDPVDPIDVTFKVATDADYIYVLLEVPGGFVYDPADHNLSAAVAVQFQVDDPAAPHMGAEEPDLDVSLGMVDIWHWELDCAPGATSGGSDVAGGDDPACNLDDEYATRPEVREDDGGGDLVNDSAENSLTGVWEHSARASGAGADGTWIFEFSRPLQTGDPQDAQFVSGGTAHVGLAFFDPTEGAAGWSDAGHLQSAYNGWIEVTLP